ETPDGIIEQVKVYTDTSSFEAVVGKDGKLKIHKLKDEEAEKKLEELEHKMKEARKSAFQKLKDKIGIGGVAGLGIAILFVLSCICLLIYYFALRKVIKAWLDEREKRSKYPNIFTFWEDVKAQSLRQYSKISSDEKYVCEKAKQTKIVKQLESEDADIDSGEDPFNDTLVKCSKDIGNKIKAHYVSDVSPKRKYILSDGPRKESTLQFFKMLFLEDVSVVVSIMYRNPDETEENIKDPVYWPEAKLDFKELVVESIEDTSSTVKSKLSFKVTVGKESKIVHIFHVSDWREFDLPIGPKNIIELYKAVSEVAGDKTVLVQNSKGVGPRVFIFVYFCCILEKMTTDETTTNPMEIVARVREKCQGGNISFSEFSFIVTSLITYFFENGFLVDKELEQLKLRNDFDNFMYEVRHIESDVDKNLIPLIRFIKLTDVGKLLDIVKESRDVQKIRDKKAAIEKCKRFFFILNDPKLKERIRFTNVACLDNASVYIGNGPTTELTSFIHANEMVYDIKGGLKRKIIMCQAPLPGTFEHMYEMMFKYDVGIIVLLVNPAEARSKPPKWSAYLPDKNKQLKSKVYTINGKGGKDIDEHDITEADYAIALNSDNKQFKCFKVFHYEAWPDRGVPENTTPVLELYKRIINDKDAQRNIVIHCSAGIGRTGTLALIILMLDTLFSNRWFNPIKSLDFLRKHRIRAVQTDAQFAFAIAVVLDYFKEELTKIDNKLYSSFEEIVRNIYKS
uniref:Tyrosine-protein phosphatase domain-containing protein n=1 Tax=Parastrongyloides trichosuri TaxID=131310 RepID=A0A0N4Z408_PARTI